MTVASKTELLQMRFVRMGGAFCSIATQTTIDSTDYSDKGGAFFGVSNEITPPVYTYTANPVRQGAPFKITALRQIRYGGVTLGQPIFSQTPTPTYTPYTSNPVRLGAPFKWQTGNANIDASSDFYQRGAPFYVYFSGTPPPVTFDASQFFIMF